MSVAERLRHELREIGLVTLYFLGWFLFFLSLKALLLDEYGIDTPVLGTAVVGALVVAKVVVLLGKTSFGNWLRSRRVFVHVLVRSLAYTAVVFAVTLAEHLFHLYRQGGGLSAALSRLRESESLDHVVAFNLSVALSFVVYNAFAEIGRHMGGRALRDLFFGRRRGAEDLS